MKKISILLFLFFTGVIFAQSSNDDFSKFNNIRTLESKKDVKEEIIIRKPDNSAMMSRTKTESSVDMKIDIQAKIKESNKLLY